MKRMLPYLLILIGLILLLFVGQAIPAGVCFLLGVVMIFEKIWPEKWDTDKEKNTAENI